MPGLLRRTPCSQHCKPWPILNRRFVQSTVAIAFTLAVHVALWWVVSYTPEQPRATTAASRVTVLIFPTTVAPAPREPEAKREPPTDRQVRTSAAAPAFSPVRMPSSSAAAGAFATPVEPAASEPVATAPLNLKLPRAQHGQRIAPPGLVGEALNDPRTNTPRATPGERMARLLGTDQTVVEVEMNGGALRTRKGNKCVITRPARGAQIDPFTPGADQSPRLAEPCD